MRPDRLLKHLLISVVVGFAMPLSYTIGAGLLSSYVKRPEHKAFNLVADWLAKGPVLLLGRDILSRYTENPISLLWSSSWSSAM